MQNKNSKLITRFLTFTILLSFFFSCTQGQKMKNEIQTAASQPDEYLPIVVGKRVGLAVNHSSILYDTLHLVDFLLTKEVNVVKIFSPEHGFRGNAAYGEYVSDERDLKTGIPIVSLYGKNRKVPAEQLKGLDIVIFDIQDVGARFFTYISTMHYVMEACAENGVRVIVLDRPNPNGYYVDGPVMQNEFKSFVGIHNIPIVHGMTVGELANMINDEGWLTNGIKCDLTVIKMQNYDHNSRYSLPVAPSPNLPNDKSVNLYPSICLFEGTEISLGRGTDFPFQVLGYPEPAFGDFKFTPVSLPGIAPHPPSVNKECFGIDLRQEKELNEISLKYLIEFYQKWDQDKPFFKDFINNLAGTAALREQIKGGWTEEEIKASWQPGLEEFKKLRKKYLLYKDFE